MAEAEGLGRVALRYTLLRAGCAVGGFALAWVVLELIDPRGADLVFKALLIGLVVSMPVSFVLGRSLRARLTEALAQSRAASRARVDDSAARVRAAQERQREAGGGSGPPSSSG